jgi:hypothetical protein
VCTENLNPGIAVRGWPTCVGVDAEEPRDLARDVGLLERLVDGRAKERFVRLMPRPRTAPVAAVGYDRS